MKIVHLSTTDYGGAFKAAKRISESMESAGLDSKVVVRTKTCADDRVYEIFSNPLEKFYSKCKNVGNLLLSENEIISDYFGTNVLNYKLVREADVVFLHWVNSFVSYRGVEQLIKSNKKIIWVMHDMWLFTGGCHCDKYCGKYKIGCGNCPMLKRKGQNDISRKNFLRKQKMMSSGKIQIVGPSNWLVECAKKSAILYNKFIECIPNPINTDVFHPMEIDNNIKDKYELKTNKKIILFGAVNSTEDSNKGSRYIEETIKLLDDEKYMLVVFGNKDGYKLNTGKMEAKYLGYIYEEEELAKIYNIADVFVAPSEQESFGYTVGEALACGTPVVAFDIGGIKDQIKSGENGYLADLYDCKDLYKGIELLNKHIEKTNFLMKLSYERIGRKYLRICVNNMK